MSHIVYNEAWRTAQDALKEIVAIEPDPEKQKPVKDINVAFEFIAKLYVKYGQAFNVFERCYDQIVQPQKRLLLRTILDGVIGRILELKQEMVNLEFSEYHYFDDILSDMQLTPSDSQIAVPNYFVQEAFKVIQDREAFLYTIRANFEGEKKNEEEDMPVEEAILLIQRHERARQGRLRAKFMREIRAQEEEELNPAAAEKVRSTPRDAAICIQKNWRAYLARRLTSQMRKDELIWLGMEPMDPHHLTVDSNAKKMAKRIEGLRRVSQAMNAQEYEQALITIKEKIRQNEGVDMQDRMQEQIRQWFLECRDANGKFPDYPSEESGGSLWVFKQKPPEMLAAEEAARLAAEQKKREKDKPKPKKPEDKKKKKKDEPDGWVAAPSLFLERMKMGCEEYDKIWKHRDENNNFFQRHEDEIIKEAKRAELDLEIRVHVDELMRQELRNLKIAIDKERQKRIPKKKPKKQKKPKKHKKVKDLTPDRTLESVYEELVMQNVIKQPEKVRLSDYFGEYTYLGKTLRDTRIEPQPSLNDVKQLVTLYAILRLGSPAVHLEAPLVRSIMLAGPLGTGKKMLVSAICNETGANLFDLTAKNLMGKYPNKEGTRMLISMVFKVARLLQPSVIMIDNCERMFCKKIPKTDPTDPKRLKGVLSKAMKTISPEDRILLIGCSMAPFDGTVKPMCNLYERIILVPRPDYASRYLIWRVLIPKYKGVITDKLDISSLARISDGYTMGMMGKACEELLSERRLAQLEHKPLTASEFIVPLSRIEPVFQDEEDAYKTWYRKTPMGKKRAKAIELAAETAANAAKNKGKRR